MPTGMKDRLDEDTRDLILECSEMSINNSKIEQMIASQLSGSVARKVPSSKQIGRFVFNRRRRKNRKAEETRDSVVNDEETRIYSDNTQVQIQTETVQTSTSETTPALLIGNPESNTQGDEAVNSESAKATDKVDNINLHTASVSENSVTGCPEVIQNGPGNSGFVLTYYDQSQGTPLYASGTNLSNSADNPDIYNLYTGPKLENQAVDSVIMEQQFNQLPSNIQFQTSNLSASVGEFTNVMNNPVVTQLGQDCSVTGSQPVQILPQMPPSFSGVQVINVDSEGQQLYGNYGDLQSLIVACQQQSSV